MALFINVTFEIYWSGLVNISCKMSNEVEKKVGLHILRVKVCILKIQYFLFLT